MVVCGCVRGRLLIIGSATLRRCCSAVWSSAGRRPRDILIVHREGQASFFGTCQALRTTHLFSDMKVDHTQSKCSKMHDMVEHAISSRPNKFMSLNVTKINKMAINASMALLWWFTLCPPVCCSTLIARVPCYTHSNTCRPQPWCYARRFIKGVNIWTLLSSRKSNPRRRSITMTLNTYTNVYV